MKKGWIVFWIIYILFFCIPFPTFLYYNTRADAEILLHPETIWSYVLLALSVVLWLLCLLIFFRKTVWYILKAQLKIKRLMEDGVLVPAKISRSEPLAKASGIPGGQLRDVVFAFDNFVGTPVTERMEVNDSKPYENRYEEGKILNLRIDPRLLSPHLMPDGTKTLIHLTRIVWIIAGLTAFVVLLAGFYVYAYQYEGKHSWSFFEPFHPLILCPFLLLFFAVGLYLLLKNYFWPGKHTRKLKFYGKRTMAELRKASQTGILVNDQPQVLFELRYTDEQGKEHSASVKKIVDLLNLHITRMPRLEIFYLPDQPRVVAFAADLED